MCILWHPHQVCYETARWPGPKPPAGPASRRFPSWVGSWDVRSTRTRRGWICPSNQEKREEWGCYKENIRKSRRSDKNFGKVGIQLQTKIRLDWSMGFLVVNHPFAWSENGPTLIPWISDGFSGWYGNEGYNHDVPHFRTMSESISPMFFSENRS